MVQGNSTIEVSKKSK